MTSWEWLEGTGPIGQSDIGTTPIPKQGNHLVGIAPDYGWELRRTIMYVNWGVLAEQLDTTDGSLEPGWWLGIIATLGLYCDRGTGVLPANVAAPTPPGNNWLWKGVLRNTLGIDPVVRPATTEGWRFQVKLEPAEGKVDVESIRPATGTVNPPNVFLYWNITSMNTTQVDAPSGLGFYTPVTGSTFTRNLWKSPS